jgi:hypothetical protein
MIHKERLQTYSRAIPPLARTAQWLRALVEGRGKAIRYDVLLAFPAFVPSCEGSDDDIAALTALAINCIFPSLSALSACVNASELKVQDLAEFVTDDRDRFAAAELKSLFDSHGSDKANPHNYHDLYSVILRNREDVRSIFEIGLGTNHIDMVSNMGEGGIPGASLRAFRDYCGAAQVYGADIDKRVLFDEERIQTFYVDQTSPATFHELSPLLPDDMDLIIDDGLHSPLANVESLRFGLHRVRVGGWVVIEDIVAEAMPVWQVVAAILPGRFKSYLFKTNEALVFAVQRLD